MIKGEKALIADYFSFITWGTMILFMLCFMVLFKEVSDNNHFISYASHVVSRYGGMTEDAKTVIETYSNESYGGRYRVESEIQAIQDYGTPINFVLSIQTKVLFFEIPLRFSFSGQSVSRIR